MARRRFVAPARAAVAPDRFAHPVFAGFTPWLHWATQADWPGIEQLDAAMPLPGLRFARQDSALLDDGLHYEARIAERGLIATRDESWHDLFNAMVWCRRPAIKQALNARQVRHIGEMGSAERNRAQYALTQFDEAGVIVRVDDAALLAAWDRHDWTALFFDHADAWRDGRIEVIAVIGHAVLEQALLPARLLLGKALVVQGEADADACVGQVAKAIDDGQLLDDPQELRPLPLAGIPGWHAEQGAAFYRDAPCFKPVREGRTYPRPITAAG